MGQFRLFNVLEDKRLVKDPFSDSPFILPDITSGDRIDIQYSILKRNVGGDWITTPWERVAASAYSLRIGVFLTASPYTQLAYQTSFSVVTDDAYSREGILALDTAAIDTLLTSATSAVVTFEIEATFAGGDQTLFRKNDLTLKKALIPSGTSSEQPGQTTATQEWVKGLFVPRDGTGTATSGIPCDSFFLMGADGVKYSVFADNGQLHCEPFVPA